MILHKLGKTNEVGTALYSKKKSRCRIRDDCEIGTKIFLGDEKEIFMVEKLSKTQPIFSYRFINAGEDNEQFQVYRNGMYRDAQTVDFDF